MPYLSNGSVAWEIPEESAVRYKNGLYRPPSGWLVILKIPKKSRQASGGQWYPPDGEVFVDDRASRPQPLKSSINNENSSWCW